MERWRWVPRDLGKTHVMVNIPDFTLRVMRDDKLVWKTKVVVGKPRPADAAAQRGDEVHHRQSDLERAAVDHPQRISAGAAAGPASDGADRPQGRAERDGTIRIYQPPGDSNALGRIRFNFPNKFLVYQHDTPDKHLFAHDKRAYSHGCMRVENPLKYGEVMLWLGAAERALHRGARCRRCSADRRSTSTSRPSIPVHITYQTAFVDEDGKLQIRDDVYGRDQRLLAILKGSERKMADIAIDRPKGSSSAPVRMPPGTFGSGTNSSAAAGRSSSACSAARHRRQGRAPASAPTSGGSPRANTASERSSKSAAAHRCGRTRFEAQCTSTRKELRHGAGLWKSICRTSSPRSRPLSTATKRR